MKISDRAVPSEAVSSFGPESFQTSSAIALEVASIINLWSQVEAYVEGIVGHLSLGDSEIMETFRSEKGWDRRARALQGLVIQHRPDRQDLTAALLQVVKQAAEIRNEVAHGVWAADAAHRYQMLLYPNSTFGSISAAIAAGLQDADTQALIVRLNTEARVVSLGEAMMAKEKVQDAYELMHMAFLAFFHADQDLAGKGFQDKWSELENHSLIGPRAKDRSITRLRDKRRRSRADTPGE
jgi:hypothetical protein